MSHQNDAIQVHLTEQEVKRIQSTVEDRIAKRSALSGTPRQPRDAHGTISQATLGSLLMDMGSMTGARDSDGKLPVLTVGQCYPPCTVALRELQRMSLADLRMETHHTGHRLAVRRVSPVVMHAARSWTVVQDETGAETERLEICLHKTFDGEDILESATLFEIKEPYFTLTDQDESTIRIDHPSDLVRMNEPADVDHAQTSASLASLENGATVESKARVCKDLGNAALKQQDLPLARARYTQALTIVSQQSVDNRTSLVALDIFRNRSYVNLLLGRQDEAIADAKASIIGGEDQQSQDLDSKAYFRAGCAAYSLGKYFEAKKFFEKQLMLAIDRKSAKIHVRKCQMRLREQERGFYDLKKLGAGLSRTSSRVDAANFVSNTRVGNSPGRGRGLFAAHHVPAGEIILAEKAYDVVWGNDRGALAAMTYDVRDRRIRLSPVSLTASIVRKLLRNPSQSDEVLELYSDYRGGGESACQTEDWPVVDVFRVHDIVSRNAFGADDQHRDPGARNTGAGLWVRAAYINHSCMPNTKKNVVGDLLIIRAARDIAAGEEIFNAYDGSTDYDARREALMATWGFECDCALCTAEKADGPAVRAKRLALATEANDFVERVQWANAKRLTIAKARRLAQAIDETYDGRRYEGLPHVAVQGIREWLARAGR